MKTFWLLLTIAAVAWYSLVTIYVAFKGVADIKEMLGNLKKGQADQPEKGE